MLILAVNGCGASQSGNNELSLKIDHIRTDAWINLMPGSSHKFFLKGEFNISNYSDSAVDSIKISKCLVYQNNVVIYDLVTDLKDSLGFTLSVPPGKSKTGFISCKGVEFRNDFNPDKPVDLDIYFTSANKTKQVKIPAIEITKAY